MIIEIIKFLKWSKYIVLEECSEDHRRERERYWINKLECVNFRKLNGEDIERTKKRRAKRYQENREEISRIRKEKYKLLKLLGQKNNLS